MLSYYASKVAGEMKISFFFGKTKDSFKVLVADYLPRNVTALFKTRAAGITVLSL